jgi:hypothetical protein
MLSTSTAQNHLLHPIRLQEHIVIRLNCILKRLIGHNLGFALHESLKAIDDRVEILFGDFVLPFCHVVRLFAVERIGNASGDEDVKLNALFAFLLLQLLAFRNLGGVLGLLGLLGRRWGSWALHLIASH